MLVSNLMAYFPGSGVKKPLNIVEGPMFPDIKQALPRFVDAGKHWTVDTGATVLDTGHLDQTLNGAILAQSRSYNQSIYGQSSSKDVVNKNFRPPLLSQDDFLPLSRQPRKIVVPRINPSGVADSYFTQNNRPGEIDSFLTDRVKAGEWRPTFFAPITFPNDSNALVPDLELTLPHYAAPSGVNTPARIDAPPQLPVLTGGRENFTLLLDSGINIPFVLDVDVVRDFDLPLKRPHYKADAGVNTPVTLDMKTPLTQLELAENRPRYSAGAGMNNPALLDMETPLTQLELAENRPRYSAGAGVNNPALLDMETPLTQLNLKENRPRYSADSGVNNPALLDMETALTQLNLKENRPRYSAEGRMNTPVQLNMETPLVNLEFQSQLDSKLFANPGTGVFDGHDYTVGGHAQLEKVGETLPQVSYTVPPKTSVTAANNRSLPSSFAGMRDTVVPDTSSYTSSGAIPRTGLEVPNVNLKPVNNKNAIESQRSS